MMFTIQHIAAFVTMLLRGPPREVLNCAEDKQKIIDAFKANQLFYADVGGVSFTSDMQALWVDSVQYLNEGRVPPLEIMLKHEFVGLFAHWFWTTLQRLGEDDYFATPPMHYTQDVVDAMNAKTVEEGWLIAFILPYLHYEHDRILAERIKIEKVLKREPVARAAFPFLGTLYHNNDQE